MGGIIVRRLGEIAALVIVAVILWVDVATGLWQDYVVLSGIAAGLVTFVLTTLVIDRIIARSTHRRWAPVTRLALTDMLHALADEEASEIAHGRIVPRTIDPFRGPASDAGLAAVRHQVVVERQRLADALAKWSTFLASSADATDVLDHAADVAERLDLIRDAATEAESALADRGGTPSTVALDEEIVRFNASMRALVDELRRLIAATDRLERPGAARRGADAVSG